jgi:hypothetical protein
MDWQHLMSIMLLLMLLIHCMFTQDMEYQFAAAEALVFCHYMHQTYSDLSAELPLQVPPGMNVGCDLWWYLPNEFAQL